MPSNGLAVVKVAHENAFVEAGLRHILEAAGGFEVQPNGARTGEVSVQRDVADVIIMDHETGVKRARDGRHDPRRSARILVVSTTPQDADVRGALEAGVYGYVVAGCSVEEVVKAVRAVADKRRYLCGSATLRMADSVLNPSLTLREGEVLGLVSRGYNNKEVARSLGISLGTVKTHVRGLLSKLGAGCRTEALCIASQRGLITQRTCPEDWPGATPPAALPCNQKTQPFRLSGVPRPSIN